MTDNVWSAVLDHLRSTIDPDEYRRWFSASAQAADSGDQLTVWIPSVVEGRHITTHYLDRINRELERLGRDDVSVRFVTTGYGEDEESEYEE
jgi:chromosomal replication initiation ATPase DnaA